MIKAITRNPLIEKLKAKQAQTFDKFRSKYLDSIENSEKISY